MDLKIPPQNLEAERAVLGSLLIDNSAFEKVGEFLKPSSFYDPRNSIIFNAILELSVQNKPIDALTLTDQLKRDKKFKQAGGSVYISEIVTSVPTSLNIEVYANIVHENEVRRELISLSAELDQKSRDEGEKVEDVIDTLEQGILDISKASGRSDFFNMNTLLELHMERADLYAKNPDALRGYPTGLKGVDKILGGLHKSDLIILAARPSVGKSAFAIHLARNIAVYEKKTVAIFSLEMPAIQVIERMLAQQSEIDMWNLKMGKLSEKDYKRLAVAHGELNEANLLVDETPGINMVQIRSKAKRLMIEKGLDMIIIDYLQLMQTREIENRAVAVGELSRSLKILARELNIPVIALSQLNRAVENRSERVPQLSDLRESGSIEQDADIVMFLSRESSGEEEGEQSGNTKVDLTIAKHRNGPIGKVSLEFVGRQQRFVDITQ